MNVCIVIKTHFLDSRPWRGGHKKRTCIIVRPTACSSLGPTNEASEKKKRRKDKIYESMSMIHLAATVFVFSSAVVALSRRRCYCAGAFRIGEASTSSISGTEAFLPVRPSLMAGQLAYTQRNCDTRWMERTRWSARDSAP